MQLSGGSSLTRRPRLAVSTSTTHLLAPTPTSQLHHASQPVNRGTFLLRCEPQRRAEARLDETTKNFTSDEIDGRRLRPMADRPQEDLIPNVNLVQPEEQEPKIRTIYKVTRRLLELTLMETYKNKRYAGDPDAVE
ncbi:hypothetical protein BJ508DRAFT_327234 [Ascobolus immersus RN42]|uniref:Uncharacterized protein n=1 Tax=Ascobolus immersus RN42 TaxID=1160509 RepID=A0A3N4I535_ASCIM|nr:hypothetical protein BJ508DRAFT_327234 [Ascobolus immersus RN42]